MYERIKFSNLRNSILGIRYLFKLIGNKLRLFNHLEFKNFDMDLENIKTNKILIFCPSLNLDTPSFLNVGLRAFINAAKFNKVNVEIIQCLNFLNICHLGGSPFSSNNKMPCFSCKKINSRLYKDLKIHKLSFEKKNYINNLESLNLDELKMYKYKDINLGRLVTSSIIWIKRHSILNETSRDYFIKLLNDSINILNYFENFEVEKFNGIVVFNGLSFPESILYELCKQKKLNVATFEGGMSKKFKHCIEFNYGYTSQHYFNFERDRDIDNSFYENDNYRISSNVLNLSNNWSGTVSIFTNVSWDTSQFISNSIFESMYDWLNSLKPIFTRYEDINFVIRPHPGENRKTKKTFYTVSDWYFNHINEEFNNVSILNSQNASDSYNLIKKSNLILVYNSTIGIEGAILGKKVLTSAKSHYSDLEFISSPENKRDYFRYMDEYLSQLNFEADPELMNLSKKYFYQLYNDIAYPLDDFIENKDSKNIQVLEKNLNSKKMLENAGFLNLVNNFLNKKEIKYINQNITL